MAKRDRARGARPEPRDDTCYEKGGLFGPRPTHRMAGHPGRRQAWHCDRSSMERGQRPRRGWFG